MQLVHYHQLDFQLDDLGCDCTKFGGYPGFETAQYDGRYTETQGVAIVENRFVVAVGIEGRNLDKDILEKVFDEFSFRRLKRLAE